MNASRRSLNTYWPGADWYIPDRTLEELNPIEGIGQVRLIDNKDEHYYLHPTVPRDKIKSVTTLLHQHFPEFKRDVIARRTALRSVNPLYADLPAETLDEKIELIKRLFRMSAPFGSAVHEMIECQLNGRSYDESCRSYADMMELLEEDARDYKDIFCSRYGPIACNIDREDFDPWNMSAAHPVLAPEYSHGFRQWNEWAQTEMPKYGRPYRTEVALYDEKGRAGGVFDMLLYDEENDVYTLADFKTCRSIPTDSEEFGLTRETEHMRASKFNVYSTQLSTYNVMLEDSSSISADNMIIIHLPGGFGPPVTMQAADFRQEARAILNRRRMDVLLGNCE